MLVIVTIVVAFVSFMAGATVMLVYYNKQRAGRLILEKVDETNYGCTIDFDIGPSTIIDRNWLMFEVRTVNSSYNGTDNSQKEVKYGRS